MSERSYRRRQNATDRAVASAQPAAPSLDAANQRAISPPAPALYGHSFDTLQIHPAPVAVQPKLMVNAPGDSYEQEAERVAQRVMATPDQAFIATASAPQIQRSSEAAAASVAPAAEAAIEAVRSGGGRPLDTATRAFMEPRFGYDFGHIRIHADRRAATAARAINAAAFTLGSDIAFGDGRYQPQSDAGRQLLAHELTHTVQQGGGAAQVQAAPLAIQRSVDTLGGEWNTDKYDIVNDGNQDIGVEINKLRFKAKDPVDATKIGLTQMVNSIDKGSVVALNDTVKSRSIPSTETDAGSHMDRKATYSNPIYGMDEPTDKGKTLGGSVSTGNSEWGNHFKDAAGKDQHQDAALYDQPTLGDHGANASQIFETAALAIDGPQAGTYYGTVRWGWQSDASNKFTKLPLSVVSVGVPSATFNRSAELWNAGKSSTGTDSVDLPIAAGSSGNVMPAAMTNEQIDARLVQIKAEIANPGAGKTIQTLEFEQRALKTERLSRMGDFPVSEKDPDTMLA